MTDSAHAAPHQAPDPAFFTPTRTLGSPPHLNSDVLLVASRSGSTNALDSPQSIVMAYFDNPTGNRILIGNGSDLCGIPGNNTGVDGTTAAFTTFLFYNAANNSLMASMTRNSNQLSCDTDAIPVPTIGAYRIPGTDVDKYVVRVVATNSTVDSINAFRVSMDAGRGVMSYYDQSTRQFAIQDRRNWGPLPAGNETRMDLPFAASCVIRQDTDVTLRWFDDDWGASNQSSNMRMRLLEDGVVIATNPTSNFTGENREGNWTVRISPGKRYIWRWEGVSERNGIQFQLPFDSFYYSFTCDNPPRFIVVNRNCNHLGFHMTDPEGDRYNIRLIIDGNEGPLLDNNGDGFLPGENYSFNGVDAPLYNYRDYGTHTLQLRARSRTGSQLAVLSSVATIGPCAVPTCTSTVLNPSSPSVGQQFELRQTFNANIGAQGNPTLYRARLELSGPGGITTTPYSAGPGASDIGASDLGGGIGPNNAYVPQAGGNSETAVWRVSSNTAGEYTGRVVVSGGFDLECPINASAGNTVLISRHPYLRVWRGDVLAGCTVSDVWQPRSGSGGGILTRSLGLGRGAGTDLAAQAVGAIAPGGFTTGQRAGMTGTAGEADKYLSFANTTAGWGGQFGAGGCAGDYFAARPASPGTPPAMSSLPTTSGAHSFSGGSTGARTISAGQQATVYVDGDLRINGNVTYAGSGGWSSVSQIPSLTVVVRGDILIHPNVTQLSGTYIAQPREDGSGGTIYTCTPGGVIQQDNPAGRASLITNCGGTDNTTSGRQLTIYGSFIARTVKFLRLSGSTINANAGDGANAGTAGEKFIYSPEVWMREQGGTDTQGYDAITSVPPVF